MSIKTVLFDLDGTLLPMDLDIFVKEYFKALAANLATHGYDPEKLIDAVWLGTKDMIHNDGSKINAQAFWDRFTSIFGPQALEDMPLFDEFYRNHFDETKKVCGFDPAAAEAVYRIKEMGLPVVLATNPIFPPAAVEKRITWAGLQPEDFQLYTTYENCRYSKPHPKYYADILAQLNLRPEECLMVGNDTEDDMVARQLGMKVFLLTAWLINKSGEDISQYPHGDFQDLLRYIEAHI